MRKVFDTRNTPLNIRSDPQECFFPFISRFSVFVCWRRYDVFSKKSQSRRKTRLLRSFFLQHKHCGILNWISTSIPNFNKKYIFFLRIRKLFSSPKCDHFTNFTIFSLTSSSCSCYRQAKSKQKKGTKQKW